MRGIFLPEAVLRTPHQRELGKHHQPGGGTVKFRSELQDTTVPSLAQSREPSRLDERNHVVLPVELHERRKIVNWLEDNQVEEDVKQHLGE